MESTSPITAHFAPLARYNPLMPSRRSFLLAATAAAAAPSLSLQAQRPSAAPPSDLKLPAPIAALTSRRSEAVPITLDEREQRVEHARQLLAQHKIDALVIATGTSLNYFTGLRWGQSERFFAWVLPVKGSPFIVCPVFEEGRVRERMEAKPATLPAASTTKVYTWNEDENPYALVAKALKEAASPPERSASRSAPSSPSPTASRTPAPPSPPSAEPPSPSAAAASNLPPNSPSCASPTTSPSTSTRPSTNPHSPA